MITQEKDRVYVKIEEIRLNDKVKKKRNYISRDEFKKWHQDKCTKIANLFGQKSHRD